MDYEEIKKIAEKQLAIDYNISVKGLKDRNNYFILKKEDERRRKTFRDVYSILEVLAINNKIIMLSDSKSLLLWLEKQYKYFEGSWFSSFSNLNYINTYLNSINHEIGEVYQAYIPSGKNLSLENSINIEIINKEDIYLYEEDDRIQESFAFSETIEDILGVKAVDNRGNLMGLAGASRDTESMWQIGVDVMYEYRGNNIASLLVNKLKELILEKGKVPFYRTISSHTVSQNVALKSGFKPFWFELKTKEI